MCFKQLELKKSLDRYINRYLLITLGLMTGIFLFSHSTGDESVKQSGLVVTLLSHLPVEIDENNTEIITIIVRKGAHMTEYFLLTLSLIKYFWSIFSDRIVRNGNVVQWKEIYLWSGIISFLYACSDEFHQTFIPGRAGLFTDVLVDSVGIIFALISVSIFRKIFFKTER